MDKETLDALKGSVAKWVAIEAGDGMDIGWKNCPLCAMFNPPNAQYRDCDGCPVAEAAGTPGCENTPYIEWVDSFDLLEQKIATTPELKALARAELDFLRSLLPTDATALPSAQRQPQPKE